MFGLPARQRAQRAIRRQQVSRVVSVPACVGGWNARDNLANMPAQDAVTLINWFCAPTDVRIRKGYVQHVTGIGAATESLMLYVGDTQEKLFAAAGTSFYDVSIAGAVGAAVQTGLTNAQWIHTNFTTTGGTRYLVCVNGVDKMRIWNGAAWITVDGASTPAITGLTTSEISYVTQHKSRMWFARKNTCEVYYSPVGGFGAAALFDLRSVFKRGGNVVAMETWSIDGGYGLDDHLVFISSNGEVAIYRGTDPSDATKWSIIGLYYFSSPIGKKCLFKYGGDLLVLCYDGLLPLSQSLQSSRVNTKTNITDKIQFPLAQQIGDYASTYGWQMTNAPTENCLIINVPQATAGTFEQYVMSTITGAWSKFQGWNSYCWEVWKDQIFFGGSTYIGKAFTNYDDAGAQITTDLKTAFNYFSSRGTLKQWTMVRPIISSDGNLGISYGANIDFDNSDVTGVPSVIPSTYGVWDSGLWDVALWGGDLTIQRQWQYLSGIGYCAAFRMKTASSGTRGQLSSIDYVFEIGGVM